MKKTFFLLLLLLPFTALFALSQELIVESFSPAYTDLSAATMQRTDVNGNPCGLVKVQTILQGMTFEGNVIGDAENHNGEYWVYLTPGTKMFQLKHSSTLPTMVTLSLYDIPEIESKVTYIMRVQAPNLYDPNTAQNADSNMINGHEYVDLGLPSGIKWATCNIGAKIPQQYGDYFSWGETKPKDDYSASATTGMSLSDISGTSYDAARVNWGASWRMPSEAECRELMDKCNWKWTSLEGKDGYKITGPNGSWIFVPAAGLRLGKYDQSRGVVTDFWTSTPYISNEENWIDNAAYSCGANEDNRKKGLAIKNNGVSGRFTGRPIRPVSD